MKPWILFIFLLLSSSAEAGTYWVSKQGNDGNACTNSATDPGNGGAKLTINEGVKCLVSAGDTLNIKSGTYHDDWGGSYRYTVGGCDNFNSGTCPPNGTPGNYTTIQAAPGHERQVILTISQSSRDQFWEFRGFVQWLAFKGLVLNATGNLHRGIEANCTPPNFDCANTGQGIPLPSHFLFENNEVFGARESCFHGIGEQGIFRGNDIHNCGSGFFDHGMYLGGEGLIIENNRVHHNSSYGIQLRINSNVPFSNAIVRNNLTYDNVSAGIVTEQGPGHKIYNNVNYSTKQGQTSGFQISYTWDSFVFNNTSYNDNVCISVGPNATNIQVADNICVNSLQGIQQDQGDNNSGNTYTNNLTTGGNIFVDTSAENFQLASATGPASNNSGTHTAYFTTDANGTPRPQGAGWDRGACERPADGSTPKCPNLTASTPPASTPPSITILTPVAGSRYITNTQNHVLTGIASCGTGSFSSITWSNNQGGSGSAVGTTPWSFTGTGATLTPYQINTIIVVLTCTGTSPLIATATLSIAYNPPELIGAWSFDENSGSAPQDTSGKGNHGSFGAGVAYTTSSKYGVSALNFSGGSVTIPNAASLKIVGGFSMSAWVSPDLVYTDFRAIMVKNYDEYLYATSAYGACLNGAILGGFGDGVNNNNACSSTLLPITPQYSCVAVTYDGTALTLYRDKSAITTITKDYEFPRTGTGTLQIGNSQFSEAFDGRIDEVRLYNYGISASQVATDCDTQIGGAPPAAPSSVKIGTVGVKIGDKDVKLGF